MAGLLSRIGVANFLHFNHYILDILYTNILIIEQGNKLLSLSKQLKFFMIFFPEKKI